MTPAEAEHTNTSTAIEVATERLVLLVLPVRVAAALPRDRAAAVEALGASLADEWPLPDILDLMPTHAKAAPADAPFGIRVVIEAATNTVVGDIGFLGPPEGDGVIEIGYSIVPSRRGRGYAGEAAAGLVAWAFDQPGVAAIVAGTDADNAISRRVLARLGFERTGEVDGEIRWRLGRPEGDRRGTSGRHR